MASYIMTDLHISDPTIKKLNDAIICKNPVDIMVNFNKEPNVQLPLNDRQLHRLSQGREKGNKYKQISLTKAQLKIMTLIPSKGRRNVLDIGDKKRGGSGLQMPDDIVIQGDTSSQSLANGSIELGKSSVLHTPPVIQANTSHPSDTRHFRLKKSKSPEIEQVIQENSIPEALIDEEVKQGLGVGWLKQGLLHMMTPPTGGRALSAQEASIHKTLRG